MRFCTEALGFVAVPGTASGATRCPRRLPRSWAWHPEGAVRFKAYAPTHAAYGGVVLYGSPGQEGSSATRHRRLTEQGISLLSCRCKDLGTVPRAEEDTSTRCVACLLTTPLVRAYLQCRVKP